MCVFSFLWSQHCAIGANTTSLHFQRGRWWSAAHNSLVLVLFVTFFSSSALCVSIGDMLGLGGYSLLRPSHRSRVVGGLQCLFKTSPIASSSFSCSSVLELWLCIFSSVCFSTTVLLPHWGCVCVWCVCVCVVCVCLAPWPSVPLQRGAGQSSVCLPWPRGGHHCSPSCTAQWPQMFPV